MQVGTNPAMGKVEAFSDLAVGKAPELPDERPGFPEEQGPQRLCERDDGLPHQLRELSPGAVAPWCCAKGIECISRGQ